LLLSIYRYGKNESNSPKVKICSSALSISALAGPTPLRYSTGVSRNDPGIAILLQERGKNKDFDKMAVKKLSFGESF